MLPRTDTATSAGPTSLTPPASPLDPNTADVVTGPANRPPTPKITSPGVVDKKKLTHSLVQEVWQEITVAKPAVKYVNLVSYCCTLHRGWKKIYKVLFRTALLIVDTRTNI